MDFGRLNLTCSLSLIGCITLTGCAESSGYVEYSSLPEANIETPAAVAADVSAEQNSETLQSTDSDSQTGASENAETEDKSEVPAEGSPGATTESSVATLDDSNPDNEAGVALELVKDSTPQREIKLLVPNKSFAPIKDSDAIRVSYDDVDLEKILNVVKAPANIVEYFPDWLKQLDGKKVRMRGFMYPTFKAEGLTRFVFTRDTGVCCFGPDPYIFLRAEVKLAAGEKADYIHMQPFDVEGTFRIAPLADDDGLFQLYRIEDARLL